MAKIFISDITSISKEEWRQERKKGIGGSDVGAILGLNNYRSMFEVFYDKIGAKNIKTESERSKVAMEIGTRLEDLVAEMFQERYPAIQVQEDNQMYQHSEYPFMLANIDRNLLLPDGTQAILECKVISISDEWESTDFCKGVPGRCPLSYEYQVRHYMAVLNCDLAIVVGLDLLTKDLHIVYVTRDIAVEQEMIAAEKEFWEMVKNRYMPLVPHYFNRLCKAIKADAFKRFYGASKETVYEVVEPEEIQMFNQMNELIIKQQFHSAEAQKAKEAKEEIAMEMFIRCEKRLNIKPSKIMLNGNANGMTVTQYVSLTNTTAANFDVDRFVESYNICNETNKLSKDIDEKTAILLCGKNMPEQMGEFFTLQEKGAKFFFSKRKTKPQKPIVSKKRA